MIKICREKFYTCKATNCKVHSPFEILSLIIIIIIIIIRIITVIIIT